MNLATYRSMNGLEVSDLAERLDISLRSAYRYDRGERIPPKRVMAKIRRLTKGAVTADDFYPDAED